MDAYAPLRRYLIGQTTRTVQIPLEKFAEILGRMLPNSAFEYSVWWANDNVTHTQARAWMSAGFGTRPFNPETQTLVFFEKFK